MVWNALNANIPPSYTPPCNGTIAVVVIPCKYSNPEVTTTDQVMIAQVNLANLPDPCKCGPGFQVSLQAE